MKNFLNKNNINGKIVKADSRYVVKDNSDLNNLVLSSTKMYPNKSTSGHKHEGQEEIYFFMKGSGQIELDGETRQFKSGDIVLIEDGVFHRVHSGDKGCYFICVFDGSRKH